MTNHNCNTDVWARLIDAWRNLPENLRKQIFRAVFTKSPTLFNRIVKDIKGFSSKGLVARPASIVTRLDNLLITIDGGEVFCRLIREYFTKCNSSINNIFIHNFRVMGRTSPEMSSRQITENILATLNSDFKGDELWNLYKKALPVCAPTRFSDDPPNPAELISDDETTDHPS